MNTAVLSLVGNFILSIIKAVTGILGNSFALVADAIESGADVVSSLVVLAGIRYSTKPPDKNHPYGHGKAEPLVTFIVVGFLIVSATVIAYQSIINIRNPHELPEPYTLVVLAIIIPIKELFYRFVIKRSSQTHSTSLKADAWHHRSDAITSFIAFIGIAFALFMGKGFDNADDWAALFASGFIVYNAFKIMRPALGEIMDEHLYDHLIDEIRVISEEVEGVIATEKCFVRKLGLSYHVDLHLVVDAQISVKSGHKIAHEVKEVLQERIPNIADVHIHVEPDNL